MVNLTALVIDDEKTVCEAVEAILETEGIETFSTTSSLQAIDLIRTNKYDLIISDVKMPEMDGFEVYERVKDMAPDSIFILITAFASISSAIDAVKKGIYDYIPKPFTPDEVRIPVRRALEKRRLEIENINLRSQIEMRYSFQNIIGNSPRMLEVFSTMRHAISSESNVMITGESGTGKELVARAVHINSVRGNRKFVTLNCGAIPEGLLESELFGVVKGAFTGAVADKKGLIEEADSGTLFLDEIGELALILQVKLLRVLQDGDFQRVGETKTRNVNVRILAATNRDLKKAIAEKLFREDLYYRLNVIPIELPPLREKKEDIPLLINHFIKKHKDKVIDKNIKGISKEALHALMNYHFPGNVRELENAIEYAIAFTADTVIQRDELPKYILEGNRIDEAAQKIPIMPLRDAKAQFEKGIIMAALIESNGNISEAARLLNIHRQNLQQKIRLLGIDTASISPS